MGVKPASSTVGAVALLTGLAPISMAAGSVLSDIDPEAILLGAWAGVSFLAVCAVLFGLRRKHRHAENAAAPAAAEPDDVQDGLAALERRLTIVEEKVSQLAAHPVHAEGAHDRLEEEVRELKTVVKGIAKALRLPAIPR